VQLLSHICRDFAILSKATLLDVGSTLQKKMSHHFEQWVGVEGCRYSPADVGV